MNSVSHLSARACGVGMLMFVCVCGAGAAYAEVEEPQQPLHVPDPNPNDVNPNPTIEDLGNDRYRIGEILVDKAAGRFTAPGIVLRDEPPLEYIAVTRGGMKGYESLLELRVNAFEFNIACLLIGLDPERAKPSPGHFDPDPVDGDEVRISVSWQVGDAVFKVPAGDLIYQESVKARQDRWVYTGSFFTPSGFFAAQEFGPLIGFVHDSVGIIDHTLGIGLNQWGSVLVSETAPPPGTEISLAVERVPHEPEKANAD